MVRRLELANCVSSLLLFIVGVKLVSGLYKDRMKLGQVDGWAESSNCLQLPRFNIGEISTFLTLA